MNFESYAIITLATMIKMLSYWYPVVIFGILWMIAEKHIKLDLFS